jgi:DnaJ homolog subfamily C member 9
MHVVQEAFGIDCNLYTDVLNCSSDADKATLRKAFYRTALKYHPDKNPNQPIEAAKKFHAITAAYQILCDAELRAEYDETGTIPNASEDDDFGKDGKENPWKEYFDRIFGKVSLGDIEAFAIKYKCSDEERRDVIKEFVQQKGNLNKMMDYVMLSEPRDAQRWVEDYIQPAMDAGEVPSSYTSSMNKTLQQLKKKAEKEFVQVESEINENGDDYDEDDDAGMDENEYDEGDDLPKRRGVPSPAKKISPIKGKSTKAKTKVAKSSISIKTKKKNDMTDLIAQIQNKNRAKSDSDSCSFSNFARRYGCNVNDDYDPLSDDIKVSGKDEKKRKK